MVLVPEDVLARYERKQKIETSPLVTGMMQQDMAMSGILESENLTDAEKQKLYNARMEDYLSLRKQKDDQIPTVRVTRNEGEPLREPLRDADVIVCDKLVFVVLTFLVRSAIISSYANESVLCPNLTPLSTSATPFFSKNDRIKFSELLNDPALGGGPAAAAAWGTGVVAAVSYFL